MKHIIGAHFRSLTDMFCPREDYVKNTESKICKELNWISDKKQDLKVRKTHLFR